MMTVQRPLPPVRVIIDVQVRCWRCDRLLAEQVARPWHITCQRCKATNKSKGEG